MKQPLSLAFYGKGGIGKSTIASGVSSALAKSGKRVLHIGCDPKADSCRQLMGRKIPTVLDQINDLPDGISREDILFMGVHGVGCIEAGGPHAGMGCAGMGITAMEDELHRLGILVEDWDVIVYDVLGDVVCGGFAVPMRKRFVDRVYVVSSPEFMSLYAANSILRGVAACSSPGSRMCGGLILNHWGSDRDLAVMRAFSERVDVGMAACIPESREMKLAGLRRGTVTDVFPDSSGARAVEALAAAILAGGEGYVPAPMDDAAMDDFCDTILSVEADDDGK